MYSCTPAAGRHTDVVYRAVLSSVPLCAFLVSGAFLCLCGWPRNRRVSGVRCQVGRLRASCVLRLRAAIQCKAHSHVTGDRFQASPAGATSSLFLNKVPYRLVNLCRLRAPLITLRGFSGTPVTDIQSTGKCLQCAQQLVLCAASQAAQPQSAAQRPSAASFDITGKLPHCCCLFLSACPVSHCVLASRRRVGEGHERFSHRVVQQSS